MPNTKAFELTLADNEQGTSAKLVLGDLKWLEYAVMYSSLSNNTYTLPFSKMRSESSRNKIGPMIKCACNGAFVLSHPSSGLGYTFVEEQSAITSVNDNNSMIVKFKVVPILD